MPLRKKQELEMKPIIYLLAVTCAVLTVLGSRLVIPAFIVLFRYIEAGFAPDELAAATATATATPAATTAPVQLAVVPAEVTEEAPKKPRAARRRKPSKQLLARVEELKS